MPNFEDNTTGFSKFFGKLSQVIFPVKSRIKKNAKKFDIRGSLDREATNFDANSFT